MEIKNQEHDRVISFSCRQHDKESYNAITELKKYGNKRGISFSFLVLTAIRQYVKKLEK